jgi:pyruvate dehydrogenase E2 component (dihydrolipoamide acetyltransferase)
MPRLSDSMEEGTVVEWLVNDGVQVARGDELAEIETDKATMTYEADADGILQHVVAEGETVAVGVMIARLLTEGEARAAGGQGLVVGPSVPGADGSGRGGEDPAQRSLRRSCRHCGGRAGSPCQGVTTRASRRPRTRS